jgi:hypothetical protein
MSQNAKSSPPQGPSRFPVRQGWARAAGEGLLSHAAGAFARAGFTDASLVLRWSEIVGQQIAQVALPVKWQDGPEGAVLTLRCEAGATVLLQHETRALIGRLNAYLGAGRIARLKLVPGQLSHFSETPDHPAPVSDPVEGPIALPDSLNRLARLRTRIKGRQPKRSAKGPAHSLD